VSDGKFDLTTRAQAAETALDLLDAVAEGESISQRNLAERLGVALGLTNAVLKRCVKKGLLKIREAPARRYAYYLTPQGFAEKSRLTAEYLSHSLHFYREARQEYGDVFRFCATRGWNRVALVGATELAEIASLASYETGCRVVGLLDPERNEAQFCNLPVVRSLDEIDRSSRPHAFILTNISDAQSTYEKLVEFLPPERVLTPKLLRVTRSIVAIDDEDHLP